MRRTPTDHIDRPLVPVAPRQAPTDPFAGVDDGSLMVFVPAIMGVGLVFSVATLVRDLLRRTTGRTRERRIALETATTVNQLLGRSVRSPTELGLLRRGSYIAAAASTGLLAAGVAAASIIEYASAPTGRHPGWLLGLGLATAAVAVLVAAACVAVARRWPAVPAWALPVLRGLPLTHHPARRLERPRRLLTDGTVIAALATVLLTWAAKAHEGLLAEFDEPVHSALTDIDWIQRLEAIDVFGSTVISIGSVVIIASSGFRCRVMALVYPAAFVASWLATTLLQELVERTRPTGFGEVQAFPSGHMVQAVFIAALLPTALAVLFRLRRVTLRSVRAVLAVFVIATGLIRIHRSDHWPTDVLAGVLLGLTVVIGAHWVVAHRRWHERCSSCQWSPHPEDAPWGRALYDLSPGFARWAGRAGALGAIGASVTLLGATTTVGIPARQADDGLGPELSEPIQMALAVIVGMAGVAAVRWKAPAAFVTALCATGIGLVASIEYEPRIAFGLTLLLLIPAVLIWLSWQHHATVGAIFALAVLTASCLTATALGSREIYGSYFGPTHPASAAPSLRSAADWLWLGSVTATHATVVAGGLPGSTEATLTYWRDGAAAATIETVADEDGIARFELRGLLPDTEYDYAVRLTGAGASEESDRSFRTFAAGPQDLVIVGGSCARTGSNGAVFDRIVQAEPDLFISLGDMHYASLDSTDPDDHLDQYAHALSQPGQAALYGSVPTAYVWDDHDFGPNNSDSTSPSRVAAAEAYRQAVPNYGVAAGTDSSIAQAFSVGRVRFVLTDTRSQRTDETILGPPQLDWLLSELTTSAHTHAVVVWVNPTPWISDAEEAGDDWSNYPAERRRVADAIAAAGIDNLVMVSGDAHMVAIDDGTNSGFASDGSRGFPVLHVAALDRPGSFKGGPYSHGAVEGPGQFGRLDIDDDGGDVVTVRLSGHNWEGDELLSYEFELHVGSSKGEVAS